LDSFAEITLEANPGTFETEKFAAYRAAGVNRLSIGIQSFNEAHLKALGRVHDAIEAKRAIEIAQKYFDNFNLDLMYALPNQTLEQAKEDIETAIKFNPPHISAYHLTLEPNTLFYHQPPVLPDDDIAADMQIKIEELLASYSYEHYETSAFSKSGKQAKHNLNYWQFGDYLGIGAGAHSKISFAQKIIRQARYKQPKEYMQRIADGGAVQEEHEIKRNDVGFEFMMNALRLTQGFPAAWFEQTTGFPITLVQAQLVKAEQRGLILRDHQNIVPTLKGQRFLNELLEVFLPEKSTSSR
jgi:putative oxygen-independent coproporphyrinogen III oxidase